MALYRLAFNFIQNHCVERKKKLQTCLSCYSCIYIKVHMSLSLQTTNVKKKLAAAGLQKLFIDPAKT